ncbi:MAG TPA: hypothetical protein VGO62_20845 [Myxococcota bacterium]|jgi:hypothetical protein
MGLPIVNLDDIHVASPCSMSWDDMVGGDRVRFCAACEKNVFNLSDMKRDEALALLRGAEGRVCGRFYRRADGTVLTADCPVGVRLAARRAKRAVLGATAASLGAVAAVLGFLATTQLRRPTEGMRAGVTALVAHVEETKVAVEATLPSPPLQPVAGGIGIAPVLQAQEPPTAGRISVKAPAPLKAKKAVGKKPVSVPVSAQWMGDIDVSAVTR